MLLIVFTTKETALIVIVIDYIFFIDHVFIGFLFVIDCVYPPGNLCYHLLVTRVPRKLAGKKPHADNCGKSMILVQIMTIIMVFKTRAS